MMHKFFVSTVKPLNSRHLRVLKNLSIIKRCPLLGGSLIEIATFGTKHFVRCSRHDRYLEYPLLRGSTVFIFIFFQRQVESGIRNYHRNEWKNQGRLRKFLSISFFSPWTPFYLIYDEIIVTRHVCKRWEVNVFPFDKSVQSHYNNL